MGAVFGTQNWDHKSNPKTEPCLTIGLVLSGSKMYVFLVPFLGTRIGPNFQRRFRGTERNEALWVYFLSFQKWCFFLSWILEFWKGKAVSFDGTSVGLQTWVIKALITVGLVGWVAIWPCFAMSISGLGWGAVFSGGWKVA